MSKNVAIVQSYFDAVSKGDFDTVGSLFADDVIWYQPGDGIQSGTYNGKEAVFAHLGNFMKWSNGTFVIDEIEYLSSNADLVSAAIHFKAEKGDLKLAMKGMDLLRVEDSKIKEVWLFSERIADEDAFWNAASKD
ncbi:nuclear transport factor 2 family protein [Sphingobacterium sp. BIGb0165]|uniref:nuclear transport factor 2 family protein n=1 Tax=Sphingobacterium sp. BIGb0165 TaxID=2940615 RepID=UPI002169D3E0|nr:nuclear transport factor 2 family protein [Sphingobacterium sp. BIGb0165]MCS4226372.1 ketosteroid isomerase-like protein [Sphingobacterium sp. BIGb0165]